MRQTANRRAFRTLLLTLLTVLFAGVVSAQAGGVPAPGFTLTLLDGKTLNLADMKGSPVVLLFWAPW